MDVVDIAKKTLLIYPLVEGHCRRVANLTYAVTSLLHMSNHKKITLAAYLHDLGKTTWPPELLTKFPIEPSDWAVITAHPIASLNILDEIWPKSPEFINALVRGHHERPGGGGYPDGLQEPALEMLIIGACDVYDAIINRHEFIPGEALSSEFALSQVEQFAPVQIMDALTKVIQKNTSTMPSA
ncbi:HD domain-containing protein [Pelotomaculum isophthalicicum JI]|uniref:HD domain-containing protein n=1 Tax=Pelotomaculum isophthalicicum JI TaxID=947010 RepID=A0A9X4H7S6_9FIRM|nr:HD domain-containing phosphohydrolase [Pelotomaculum isophthalicicum]MDF9407924.1 HD domain-containing protein [Pelotomaculum isophthalicicum JI]